MPFKSQAQRRFMYANYPKIAKRWSKHTPKNANLTAVYFKLTNSPVPAEIGMFFSMPDADYQFSILRSLANNTMHKFEDPNKAVKLLKSYGLTPHDVENEMYQQAYEHIQKQHDSLKTDDGVREESLEFEALFDKIVKS